MLMSIPKWPLFDAIFQCYHKKHKEFSEMKRNSPRQKQIGFTLLEVLVVVVCVIILIGLVVAIR
jgi:hypothetical protein